MDEPACQEQLIQWLLNDHQRMQVLHQAADFCEKYHLTDWCLAAGFVRNLVWDHLHGYLEVTALDDIDLIYFDRTHVASERDKALELTLWQQCDLNWSVKNQARMHTRNDDMPYKNTQDAMSYWPEVETAVGVLIKQKKLKIIAPFGLTSLFSANVSLNLKRPKPEIFYQRIKQKRWLEQWPQLQIKL
ncbi:nucleotidyltransferase family protein [Alkanindiges sp. WGS2144]|uniref:nucleotidyltransferase family protein n=1 Tax=Alkanindiges sp. WGS2144 TaxID=3366808 RepID=UPI0037527728